MNLILCVMARDEAANVPGLLDSCPWVDKIVVLDTNSVDNTRALFEARGAVVYSEAFVDFATSRTRLMKLAAKHAAAEDYFVLADCDMRWHGKLSPDDLHPDVPVYSIQIKYQDMSHFLPRVLTASRPWTFKGAVHEFIEHTEKDVQIPGDKIWIEHKHTGSRSKGDKFINDLALLSREHLKNPKDPRTVFYLARTLRDLGMAGCAKLYFKERIVLGGFDEEVFDSRLNLAVLNDDPAELITVWLSRPLRAEPLHEAIRILRGRGMTEAARALDKIRATIPFNTTDKLFITPSAYGPSRT